MIKKEDLNKLNSKIEEDLKSINLKIEYKEKIKINSTKLSYILGKKKGFTVGVVIIDDMYLARQDKLGSEIFHVDIWKKNKEGGVNKNTKWYHYMDPWQDWWDNIFQNIKKEADTFVYPQKEEIVFQKFTPTPKDTKFPISNVGKIQRIYSVNLVAIKDNIIIEDLCDPKLNIICYHIHYRNEYGGHLEIIVNPELTRYCPVRKYGKNKRKLTTCSPENDDLDTRDQELVKRAIKLFKGEEDNHTS